MLGPLDDGDLGPPQTPGMRHAASPLMMMKMVTHQKELWSFGCEGRRSDGRAGSFKVIKSRPSWPPVHSPSIIAKLPLICII